jgi:hypothetical protein
MVADTTTTDIAKAIESFGNAPWNSPELWAKCEPLYFDDAGRLDTATAVMQQAWDHRDT